MSDININTAWVYLIHLNTPLAHAKHYIGYTALESPDTRLNRHKSGNGARLLNECNKRNIVYSIVRTWSFTGRFSPNHAKQFEKELKKYKKSYLLCPVCNPSSYANHKNKNPQNPFPEKSFE